MQELSVRNGGNFELKHIPVLNEELFRKKILEGCALNSRLINFLGISEHDGNILMVAMLGRDQDGEIDVLSMRVLKDQASYQSLTPELPSAHLFEREIAEQFNINPIGHPWLKPVRNHSALDYPFYQMQGEEIHEVSVGPVHAGIIEPGHFRFQCHGEEILNLEIQLGYQHRGIEQMMQELPFERTVLLAESIAGDTVIGHTMAYCHLMESLSDAQLPPRSEAIRAIALELERLSNHVGDLGALSTDIGFLPVAAYFGRLRGEFLNLLMELSGNRYGRSLCRPGGVLFDFDQAMIDDFHQRLLIAQKDLKEISELFFQRSSVLSRLEETGIVTPKMVKELGLVGPTARACGFGVDIRTDYAFGMYRFYNIPISTVPSGDVYARALIRLLESQRSIEFLMEILHQIPSGEIQVPLPALKPNHMAIAMIEGWRGEIMHVALTDSRSKIRRYKIKDPSFHNWMALGLAVRGGQISDFPMCNKSFNLSYAGHDL